MADEPHIADWIVGFDKAFGTFEPKGRNDKGKVEGKALTRTGELTREIWDRHLRGEIGVGVIALLEDNTVRWGAIDIDVYTLDLPALARRIADMPLVLFRTKSGGAHLYCFVREPVPAGDMMDFLSTLAAILGHGGVEVFPKQSSRSGDRDIGNWLNAPYGGVLGESGTTLRYALDSDGNALDYAEALAHIEAKALDVDTFYGLAADADRAPVDYDPPPSGESDGDGAKPRKPNGPRERDLVGDAFADGPPCLQYLAQRGGFGSGVRNEGMFNVAVYLKKKYPDDWRDKLIDERHMCDPPMDIKELNDTVTKSVGRKEYSYRCREAPIAPHCNRRLCLKRAYGVGEAAGSARSATIGSLTKYEGDPVMWVIDIDGARLELSTDELLNQKQFAKKCADVLTRLPAPLPEARWRQYLDERMQTADVVPAPADEESMVGYFWVIVERFCTQRAQATTRDMVAVNYPFEDGGKTWFRGAALLDYLKRAGYVWKTTAEVWRLLEKRLGTVKDTWQLRGQTVAVWGVASFAADDTSTRELPDLGGDGDEF